MAYYRASWEKGKPHADKNFWVGANGNFIEIAVLEWCKLFGDKKRKYAYTKLVPAADAFLAAMLAHIDIAEDDWNEYVDAMRT